MNTETADTPIRYAIRRDCGAHQPTDEFIREDAELVRNFTILKHNLLAPSPVTITWIGDGIVEYSMTGTPVPIHKQNLIDPTPLEILLAEIRVRAQAIQCAAIAATLAWGADATEQRETER